MVAGSSASWDIGRGGGGGGLLYCSHEERFPSYERFSPGEIPPKWKNADTIVFPPLVVRSYEEVLCWYDSYEGFPPPDDSYEPGCPCPRFPKWAPM